MISVPVFAPCRDLKRAKPPNILTGVDTFRKPGFEVKEAVDETLHVQTVEHPDRAEPKETGPAKEEVTEAGRDGDKRSLQLGPNRISRAHQIRTPLLHTGWFPLIQPSEMRPPEAAVTRAGHIVNRVGIRVVVAMICDPSAWSPGSVKTCAENQNLFDNRIEFYCTMSQTTVITDCRAQSARGG